MARKAAPRAPRAWIDEVFALFIEGHLGRLSASEVCRGIDWIASQPALLVHLEGVSPCERQRRLTALVSAGSSAVTPAEAR
jgi:hypothetical protein